jgi:hypothetical protein
VDHQADLLLTPGVPDRYRETLNAFVAPVANEADAVAKDPGVLQVADAVYEAFGDTGTDGGLTRGELASACCRSVSPEVFESRFDLFVSMGLLRRNADKPHQRRYVLNPASVAALLVYSRLREIGGVEEILTLLDRTRQELLSGEISPEVLAERLTRARRGLSIFAGHLQHLVRARSWDELVAERTHHRSADALLAEARDLVGVMTSRFPDLVGLGSRLISEALRYSAAVNEFCDRLLDQASARRDFSMLMPEQYLSAALGCGADELAVPFARTVFDPPGTVVTPRQVIEAVEEHRPPPVRRRPPRPPSLPPGADPVEEARRQAQNEHAAWSESFNELFAQVAGVFENASVRGHGRWYLLGLLSHQERKNSWWLAEFAGDVSPDGMQRLLNFSPGTRTRPAMPSRGTSRGGWVIPRPCWRLMRPGS